MRILIGTNTSEAVSIVSDMICDVIASRPSPVLGLATGRTMVPLYARVVLEAKKSRAQFGKALFYQLDEYLGLGDDHPSSFKSYIETHFARPLEIKINQIIVPPVHENDISKAAHDFEQELKNKGGIDLQLLGIGRNGHIGFNEPGSEITSRTRIVTLSSETIEDNRSEFGDQQVPEKALSMGIGTILESKKIVMLATGESKSAAIKYLVNHHNDPKCPATFLKSHAHFILVLDPAAASKINLNI